MKLGKTVLLEIVAIFQDAIIGEQDASVALRNLDLQEKDGVLELSDSYTNDKDLAN